ncbi:MAG TPA: thioesterase family protein, partial [Solirubrobacteraceae bacterium]
ALAAEVGDEKVPRSLTCHYLRVPDVGPAAIAVTVERSGRAVSTLSARMTQDGEPCVLAIAAFGVALDSALDYADLPHPGVAPPNGAPAQVHPKAPPIAARFDGWPVVGPALFSEATDATTGGWIRTNPPTPADAFAIAQYTDAWLPAPWTRLPRPAMAPTIDLTIHFRRALPYAGADPLAPVLLQVSSTTSAEGYFEEDAAIWAPDGTLLAQSRQLALLRPLRDASQPPPGRRWK